MTTKWQPLYHFPTLCLVPGAWVGLACQHDYLESTQIATVCFTHPGLMTLAFGQPRCKRKRSGHYTLRIWGGHHTLRVCLWTRKWRVSCWLRCLELPLHLPLDFASSESNCAELNMQVTFTMTPIYAVRTFHVSALTGILTFLNCSRLLQFESIYAAAFY